MTNITIITDSCHRKSGINASFATVSSYPTAHKHSLPPIDTLRLSPRLPQVSFDQLVSMLQLDLEFGCQADFEIKLRRAVEAAALGNFTRRECFRQKKTPDGRTC